MGASIVDSKKRVLLPEGRPGDVFDVRRESEGRFVLVRLEKPEPKPRMGKRACLAAIRSAPLKPKLSWEELRDITREP